MQAEASFTRRAEVILEEALSVAARLPRILAALEETRPAPEPAPRPFLPLALSCLAVALALLSFFT
jgi:hypothetical protein